MSLGVSDITSVLYLGTIFNSKTTDKKEKKKDQNATHTHTQKVLNRLKIQHLFILGELKQKSRALPY